MSVSQVLTGCQDVEQVSTCGPWSSSASDIRRVGFVTQKKDKFKPEGALALHVAIRSGASPLDIMELHPISGKVSARWLVVLYLLRENKMTAEDIAQQLSLHPRAVSQMLRNLERLSKADPKVMELIREMVAPEISRRPPRVGEIRPGVGVEWRPSRVRR